MRNKEDDIEDLFKDRFANDEAPIAPRVWENIKKTLPPEKDDRLGIWFFQSLALWGLAGVLVVAGIVGFFTQKNSSYQHITPGVVSTLNNREHKDSISDGSIAKQKNKSALDSKTKVSSSSNIHKRLLSQGFSMRKQKSSSALMQEGKDAEQSAEKTKKQENSSQKSENKCLPAQQRENKNKENSSLKKLTWLKHPEKRVHRNQQTPLLNSTQQERAQNNKTENIIKDEIKTRADQPKLLEASAQQAKSAEDKNKVSVHLEAQDSSLSSTQKKDSGTSKIASPLSSIRSDSNELVSTYDAIRSLDQDQIHYFDSGQTFGPGHERVTDHTKDPIFQTTLLLPPLLPDTTQVKLDTLQQVKDTTQANAEKKNKDNTSAQKWSIDLAGGWAFTGATTKSLDQQNQAAVANKNSRDKHSTGYGVGITVNYDFTNKLRLSTGLTYSTFSEQYNFDYHLKTTYWEFVDTAWQQMEVDSIDRKRKVKDEYHFISMPLQFSYVFLNKGPLQLSAAAGIRTNLLIKGATHLPDEQITDIKPIQEWNALSFSYLLSMEASWTLSSHLALLAQPVFTYSATSIHSRSSSVNQKPYSLGMQAGLRYIF